MQYSYDWKDVFNPGDADNFFTHRSPETSPEAFEPDNPMFSQKNAWWLSEMSRLIYSKGTREKEEAEVRNLQLEQHGLQEPWFYNGKHLKCAVITPTAELDISFSVLVFRGTAGNISNWLYNLKTTLSPWGSGGKVHNGFKQLLLESIEEIKDQLKTLRRPVYYTGHSLGGALAVLTASLHAPHAVYTFGAPKIGNDEFLSSLQNINIYRLANCRDIVTTIPPLPTMLHAGLPYYLKGSHHEATKRPWLGAPEFLAAHSPVNYSARLETVDLLGY
ncbi:lipase family protein [Desulforhopalus sp. 52FAK]